ncbi:hypothetical protein EO087_03625 [Dyella sp. M7H15-1]|uniref:hypothetical protein n=1 Tax=Dyella sp. M7H15-1 TaxID=2501295 RepID=UPI00100511E2|nr:hypothetical protein [Dyella sp. M7H15-1]QAU23191.1 hypothetical protein EO087_03625 [Dyella sp. M7H15-1]
MTTQNIPKVELPRRITRGETVTLSGSEVVDERAIKKIALTLYGRDEKSSLAEIERVDTMSIRFTVPEDFPENNVARLLIQNGVGDRVFLGTVHVD